MQTTYQISDFLAIAPHRPYCATDLENGLKIRGLEQAIAHPYIQHNAPARQSFLVFDFDREGVLVAHEDANLPQPTWIAENPTSRRGHIAYALATPIVTSDAGRLAPLRYAAAVQEGFLRRLGADRGYAGLITKTPGHDHWRTVWGRAEPYPLSELADWLPEGLPDLRKSEEATGLGRNVKLFDGLRQWAYRARLAEADPEQWKAVVLAQARQMNGANFTVPLSDSEVKATAKSVAKWVWKNFNATKFSQIQSERQKHRHRQRIKSSINKILEADSGRSS